MSGASSGVVTIPESHVSADRVDVCGPRRFLFKTLIFFSPLLLLLFLVELILWRTGETWSINRVIETQRAHSNALFMRGMLDQGFYRYKFLQIEAQHPKILI